ncbi:longitudinals lacking protein, isoforms A/B/D/L isoform X2 [Coccinella septempunctata]|uniref:longitudinals lacking protein, isoforms A/B/D/L isoform X2 n=1 Tax=Coccinella septempunctata TaxID=41139 RepID=UPI001D05F9AB|nr:longitudinals lacking protein, isoforms A/B/D/L isoform X2 [Coccinella septempunctata]
MEDDQQFCLRWNNHQSTLVSVFDTLLESGTLVDCTLAAEGKYLNAHKVVLSACSPYFESLLSKHYDKHPILILKDVKFQELKAMMDYMYRGEVNISQDQLGALLKAAESLQIKGLSDNRKGGDVKPAAPIQPKSPQPASTIPKVQGLTIEQRTRDDSREGSQSPGPRKKKRIRRKSEDLDNHDVHSNSSESHSNHGPTAQNIPLPAPSKLAADVPEPLETKSEIILRHKPSDEMIPQVPIKEKIETHTELMLEPKSEYVEEMNEDSIEDLTLDDDDMSNMEHMGDGAGPSHGNMGEGSSQGFGSWHLGNQSQDEVFLAAQEAVGAHRDSQDASMELIENATNLALDPNLTHWTFQVIDPEIDSLEPLLSQTSSHNLSLEKVMQEAVSGENMEDVTITILEDVAKSEVDLEEPTYIKIDTVCPEVVVDKKPVIRRGKKSHTLIELENFHRENGYECPDCRKVYRARKNLARHIRVECGKKPPLSCAYCPYRSYRNNEIQNHIKNKHMVCFFSKSE